MPRTDIVEDGFIDRECVPLAVQGLDSIQGINGPGKFTPLRLGETGGLAIELVGPSLGTIYMPDDEDGVPEATTNLRVPTVARLYGYNPDDDDFDRIRSGTDDSDAADPLLLGKLVVENRGRVYNGPVLDTWDRDYGNAHVTILPSASRVTPESSDDFINPTASGAHFIIDVTAIAGAPSITVTIEAKDITTGDYYPLLISPAISTVGTTVLKVYPGIPPTANAAASDILPHTYRVSVAHVNANAITFSVSANLVR